MSDGKLFIVEVRDENNKPVTYRIVKAIDEHVAKDFAYYALSDQGVECTRQNLFVYECIGQ